VTPESRRSPLHDRHVQLGATLTDFAGWEMPLDYGSVVAEHRAVREGAGVFDLSHLGTLRVTGPGALGALMGPLSNDASALGVGRAQYTLCLDEADGIVDDLLVYRLPWGFFVVPNAANAAAVAAALGPPAVDVKADMACIAVQGPRSAAVLTGAGVAVDGLDYLDSRPFGLSDGPPPAAGVLARSGYTGERGYELFVPASEAPTLWDRIVVAGATPAGLGARDTLRLEMGYPLHGNDISRDTTPAEAGLRWAVRTERRARLAEPSRRLRGLRVTGRGIPRAHCAVRANGEPVGETTSGTFSPTLRIGVALGYLDPKIGEGDEVEIDVRGKAVPAVVVRPPFVDADPR
jgi:aminomethyltransferase